MDHNQYDSMFDPSLKIDIANYITELIIVNYLKWQRKPLPKSPFWRKEIHKNNPDLAGLAKRYTIELAAVRDLLAVFSPTVVAKYFREKGAVGFKLVKKDNQSRIIQELFSEQVKFVRSLEDLEIRKVEFADDKRPFVGTLSVPKKNKLGL